MTKREVEIERTVTESEEVTICDYCGLDENAGKGDMVTYKTPDDVSEQKIHLHKECVEDGLGDLGPMPTLEDSDLFNPLFAIDWLVIGFTAGGSLLAVGGYNITTVANTPVEGAVGTGLAGIGVILILFAIFAGRTLATEPLDIANDWWEDQL